MDVSSRHLHADARLHAHCALIAAAVGLTVLTVLSAPAAAQMSLEVSPLRVELQTSPGGSTTQGITLTNAGTEPLRVRATLTDWDLSRDGSPQFEGVPEGVFSATAWVRVAPPEQIVQPGKDAIVRFSLAVPQGIEAGGYRTGILFEFSSTAAAPVARGRQVLFRSRIATLIYVNIGQPPGAAELVDLRSRFVNGETQVVAIMKNTSRRTLRTKGSLTLFDHAGAAVQEGVVPDVPLLPQSEREVAVTVIGAERAAGIPPGEYRVEVKIDVGLPALIVGETTIKITPAAHKVPG